MPACLGSRPFPGDKAAVNTRDRLLFRAQARAILPEGVILHGSCVEQNGNAVVFLAPSGGGKSTIAMNLASKNFFFIADDTVIVTKGTDEHTRCLPCGSLKLSTGIQDIAPAFMKAFVFLEKGNNTEVVKILPRYGEYRARRTISIISMPHLNREEKAQAGRYLQRLFHSFPAFILRYPLETDPSDIVSELLHRVSP